MNDTDIEILIDNVRALSKKPSREFKEQIIETLEFLYAVVKRLQTNTVQSSTST